VLQWENSNLVSVWYVQVINTAHQFHSSANKQVHIRRTTSREMAQNTLVHRELVP
jgi:hypothetical protein